jgi:hypothetical protein
MTIRAALLDNDGVYLRMDELESEAQLTPLHLATITECDLPAGQYRWSPDPANPFGGAFQSIEWAAKVAATLKMADDLATIAALADPVARRAAMRQFIQQNQAGAA